ncbi:hypothetical protein vseg_020912 [Gypsophila vaccaria]
MKTSALRLRYFPTTPPPPPPPLLRSAPSHSLTSKPLHHTRLYAFFTTSASASASASAPTPHPWPEWVSFVDRLKSRGYFPHTARCAEDGELVYREFGLLKDPCLAFARDRYDVFQSLPKDDIQNVVEVGCPKLVRKVINSAKRLRVYVGLEEKDVCEVCSLKGTCDRAYLKPNESESVRTVDVMRLLLFYALDPMVISGAVRPTSMEQAESSARRLMSMLMDLSEASASPTSVELPKKKEKIVNSTTTMQSEATEQWSGEWTCPKCSFLNFSRNVICRKCNEDGPKKQESAHVIPQKGDWNCPQCKFLNYAKNISCRQCNEDAPKKQEREHIQPKKGDWHCPQCNFLNYSRNRQCRKCNEDAPEKRESGHVELKTGDWNCHDSQ